MVESAAGGMKTPVDEEKTSVAAMEPQARVSSEIGESSTEVEHPDDVILSRIEKRKRLGGARRVLVCYLRKLSPGRMLKKMRDCYVSTLGSCAQNYVSSYPSFGMGLISCHASPVPPSFSMFARNHQDLDGSEFCLSPAFKKSLNESLLVLKGSGAFMQSDPGAAPFRKSFSDFESCVSPVLKRTYSDAATLYSRSPGNSRLGYCRRSLGWTPTRALGGQSMIIFPIQEAPELILASFRKEAQELRLLSCRKEAAEPELPLRKDGELPCIMDDTIPAVSNLQLEEGLEPSHVSTQVPTAV